MKTTLLLFFGIIFFSSCEDQLTYTPPVGVIVADDIYGDMYRDILIMDTNYISRSFANAIPNKPVSDIKLAFRKKKNDENFDIQSFVEDNWILGTPRQTKYILDSTAHISDISDEIWTSLIFDSSDQPKHSSLISLPYPYISVSGENMDMRYMDSYFIMLGLAVDGRWDLIQNMVDNCAYLIELIGHMPETNRTYTTSRSGQPFFSHMIDLLASKYGDETYAKYLLTLQKEYDYWQSGTKSLGRKATDKHIIVVDSVVLNRYYDPNREPRDECYNEDKDRGNNLYRSLRSQAESGWMTSSRWQSDVERRWTTYTNKLATVDLNSLLYHTESTLLKAYALSGDTTYNNELQTSIDRRKHAIDSLFWDDKNNIFTDVNFRKAKRTDRATLAMVYPLYTHLCDQAQADGVAVFIEKQLLRDGGVMDTDQYTGFEWDAPNGHPPLQYLTVVGLDNYGHKVLAQKIAKRYIKTIEDSFVATGVLSDSYDLSETSPKLAISKYKGKDGYGWTLGTYRALVGYLGE